MSHTLSLSPGPPICQGVFARFLPAEPSERHPASNYWFSQPLKRPSPVRVCHPLTDAAATRKKTPLFLARTERNPISPLPGMEVRPQNTWEGETSSLPQFAVNVTTTGIGDRLFTIRQEQSKLFQTVTVLQEVPDLRRRGKHSHKDKKMGAPLLSAGLTFHFSLSTWSRRCPTFQLNALFLAAQSYLLCKVLNFLTAESWDVLRQGQSSCPSRGNSWAGDGGREHPRSGAGGLPLEKWNYCAEQPKQATLQFSFF